MYTDAPDMGTELTFTHILRNGKPWLLASNGRLVPVIRGGSDLGAGEGAGAGDGSGTAQGAGDGAAAEADKGEQNTQTPEPVDYKADAERWKAQAQKHEREWKKFSKENEDLRKSQMSDTDKAIAEAEKRGELRGASLIAAAKMEAALTGVVPNPEVIVARLDKSLFLTEAGEVDTKAIAELRKEYVDLKVQTGHDPDLGQGRRTETKQVPGAAGRAEAAKRFGEKAQASK